MVYSEDCSHHWAMLALGRCIAHRGVVRIHTFFGKRTSLNLEKPHDPLWLGPCLSLKGRSDSSWRRVGWLSLSGPAVGGVRIKVGSLTELKSKLAGFKHPGIVVAVMVLTSSADGGLFRKMSDKDIEA